MEFDWIRAAKAGDDAAFAELCRIYAPLIDSMTDRYGRKMPDAELQRDDLKQEVTMAFYRALMSFDPEQEGVSFGLYAKICIRNRLVSLLRRHHTEIKRKLSQDRKPIPVAESVTGIDREALISLAEERLTAYEKTVFFLYIDGRSYRDIASSLGVSEKSVDNALFRAKKKLRCGYSL